MTDAGRSAHVHTQEIPRFVWRLVLIRAVKPSQIHIRIGAADLEKYFAACFQSVVKRKGSNTVGIVSVLAATPEGATHLATFAAGKVRIAETEIVGAGASFD